MKPNSTIYWAELVVPFIYTWKRMYSVTKANKLRGK